MLRSNATVVAVPVRMGGSSPEPRLLEAVLADRADVVPRLVYADWLLEQGDPRGEFIQVQCRLDALDLYDSQRRALVTRETALLNKHGAAWRAPAKGLVSDATFRRGLIEHIAVDIETFIRAPDECLAVGPVRSVKIHGNRERIGELATCPALERIEALGLSSMKLGRTHWPALFGSPHLGNLVELNLSHNTLGRAGYTVLSACESLPELRKLNLEKTGYRGPAAEALLRWPLLAQIECLRLAHNPAHFGSVADGGLRGLQVLQIGEAGVDDEAAVHLARSGCCLRTLEARLPRITADGLRTLVGGPTGDHLEDLVLPWHSSHMDATGGDERAAALAATRLPRLRRLDLFRHGVSDSGLRQILASEWAGQIASLDLSHNRLTDGVVDAVLQAELPALVECSLGANDFSPSGRERLGTWHERRSLASPSARRWASQAWSV